MDEMAPMDDMEQGGAGGVPLDDDSPQSRRRAPSAGRGRTGPGADRAKDVRGEEGEAADALSPSPRAQRDSRDKSAPTVAPTEGTAGETGHGANPPKRRGAGH
ncbi:hypothetical protein ABZ924_23430 [Streptomyces sp. NPDC046876]|uniref:hypothetical protein n=1 Tax=Streptomyces sp. NPDC046876 TaxID=3155616 RepID=UPI0033E46573